MGTLCSWTSGEIKKLADDVYGYYRHIDGKVLYIANYDETGNTFDLYSYENGNSILVGKDISNYTYSSRSSETSKANAISAKNLIKKSSDSADVDISGIVEEAVFDALMGMFA